MNSIVDMAKEKPRILYRDDRDFTRYFFLFLTTFDHMFWLLRKAEYTEYTELFALFVLFSLQNWTKWTKKCQKNDGAAVGVVETASSGLACSSSGALVEYTRRYIRTKRMGLSHLVRPKKTEKNIKKPHNRRKLVNETVYGWNPADFFVFNGLFLPMFAELSAYVYT